MNNKPVFFFLSLFLAIVFVLSAGSVLAQEEASEEGQVAEERLEEARELLQEFLPEGVTLDTADERQLVGAVSEAVSASPGLADAIVIVAIEAEPEWSFDIVCEAINAAPEETDIIVSAAIDAHPLQAETIMASAIECAPPGAVIAEVSPADTLTVNDPPGNPEPASPTTL